MNEEDARARLGETVAGRFELVRVVGVGGFGAVYEAKTKDGQSLALKLLHDHLRGHREILTRFRREARAAGSIGSEHIVRLVDSGTEPGAEWIATELLQGEDLREAYERSGPFTLGRTARILSQACEALEAAHAKGIVHRDLKPDNLFLEDRDGQDFVKVLDFGVSKFLEAIDGASLMTRTGTTIGTPFYMPPEQAKGEKEVDHRADLYALGVIAFRLLTGQHPFEATSYPLLVVKICTERPPPITRFRADVPLAFERVLDRAMEKVPSDRFASAREFREALSPFLEADEAVELRADAPKLVSQDAALLPTALSPANFGDTVDAKRLSIDRVTGKPVDRGLSEDARDTEERIQGGSSVGLWLGLAVLICLAAMAAYLMGANSGETAERVEPPPPAELPIPRPSIERPFRAAGDAHLGWRWMNPLPRAMPAWTAVAVGAGNKVAMVGPHGRAATLEGGNLLRLDSQTEFDLHAIEWIGPAQAMAVGDAGSAVLFLQSGTRALQTGTSENLRDLAVYGPTEAVVVGDAGTLVHFRGLSPEAIETGISEHLFGVEVHEETVIAVGLRGTVLREERGVVEVERPPNGPHLRSAVWCDGGFFAAGDHGLALRRGDTGWIPIPRLPSDENFLDLSCHGRLVLASTSEGNLYAFSGSRFVRIESGMRRRLLGTDARDDDAWVVGEAGLLARLEEGRMVLLAKGSTETLFAAEQLGGLVVAVGQHGSVLREDAASGDFLTVDSPTEASLAAIAHLESDRLVAVGDGGTLLDIRFDSVELIESAARFHLRDVVAAEERLLAVGAQGRALFGTPGLLVQRELDREGRTLFAVAGEPDDAIVVGDQGVVIEARSGSAVSTRTCGVLRWNDVSRVAEGLTLAVGADGQIANLAGDGCVIERPADAEGHTDLFAVALGPSGRPLALGEDGFALERNTDGVWVQVSLGAELDLRGGTIAGRYFNIVGQGGTVLRHRLATE